jgi:hypothetical protein
MPLNPEKPTETFLTNINSATSLLKRKPNKKPA